MKTLGHYVYGSNTHSYSLLSVHSRLYKHLSLTVEAVQLHSRSKITINATDVSALSLRSVHSKPQIFNQVKSGMNPAAEE